MVDAVIGGVFTALIEVTKCLAPRIGNQIRDLRNYNNNLKNLQEEVEKLTDERAIVVHKVDAAERNGEEIERTVQTWLSRVNVMVIEADEILIKSGKIITDEEKAKSHCFKELCPNLKTRYQFSKDAEEKVKAIARLREEGNFHEVSYRTIPQEKWLPTSYDFFESRKETLTKIQDALRDPNVNKIGVYGMGGIGKTTLVREIAMKAEKEKLFDVVVFADVSQTPEIRKIQGEIADKLVLKLDEETESGRARRLRERLTKEKKILIVLDNIWTSLKLEDIGIPLGDDHKGCKLLLTARSLDVLTSKVDCDNNFPVGILREEEARSLFKKMVGDCIQNRDLETIAIDVVNECRGLPIAIVTIARALRNKGVHQWKSALHDLRHPSETSLSKGVQREAYSSIELSYKYLEDDQLRSAFLLCSLMADTAFILDLLKYGIGLGLFQGVETMEGSWDKMDTLLDKLKASCLLLDGQTSESFSMHDVVRDVALSIASRDQHVFTDRHGVVPIKWPNKDALKNCNAVALRECAVSELNDELECPKLKFLYIGSRNCLVKIPNNFFKGMTELQVLDLTGMRFSSLPSSIQLLGNLRTLCLDQCELGDVSIVGELRKLEILSFISSNIEQLPKEIVQLNCLKLLDLTNCYKLKVIAPNIISSLSLLEELHMGNTFIQWDNEGPNVEGRNASLLELKHLSYLTNLEIHIKDAKILPKCTFFEKLERYQIHIGDEWGWSREHEGKRMLKLKLNADICLEDIMQLKKIEVLYLDEVHGVNNVLYEVHKEGFPELKHLHVQNSSYLRCIVDSIECVSHAAFPMLESLSLSNLINLEKISTGQLVANSFCKLNAIKVEKCDTLKNLFLLSSVQSLPQLQRIEVTECKTLEGIFAFEKDDNVNNNKVMDKIEFHFIRSLTLKSLPNFSSFCSKVKLTSMSQSRVLEENEVSLGEELDTSTTSLFNEAVVLPNLVELEVSAVSCEEIWGGTRSAMFSYCHNLTLLIIHGCGNLKYIFSSIVKSFPHLQHLEIRDCPLLREIIFMTEYREEEERIKIVFPQLNFLKIENLEKITRFCSDNYVEFPSLKQLEIKQCPVFKAFIFKSICRDLISGEAVDKISPVEIQPFFNDKVAFPSLEEMVISHLDDLKMIWHQNKLALHSFDKLKSIEVEGCDKLSTLFSSNTFQIFSRLESLTIKDCGILEDIFGLQGFEEINSTIIWLKLLNVFKCRSLKNIFPVSIAKNLLKLEKLQIINCRDIANFVGKEHGAEASIVKFVFPKVTTLKLCGLPELDSFYPGVCTSVWPVLKDLSICCCEKLKVFASEFPDVKKTKDDGQHDFSTQQPLFLVEKIVPTLETLRLSTKEIMIICHDQFPGHFFNKLKTLSIGENEAAVFPVGLLERFQNLETLRVFNSSCKELFLYKEVEKYAVNLGQIKTLYIQQLYYLKRIWEHDYKLNSIFQNLGSLHVQYCDNLVNLAPSSASFENVTILKVCYCNGMINLVTSSTAKSLKQLRDMHVHGCKRMIEIVKNEGHEAEDEIVFNKLESLSLDNLESLRYFCSGNYTFKFPSLVSLFIVGDCPRIEIFCTGALSTSKLQSIVLQKKQSQKFWYGDLNTTIKKVVYQNSEALEVSAIDFEKIWQSQHPTMSSCFQNLKCLIVHGCGQLKYLFSPFLVKSFFQLQHLEICKCSILKEIMTMEEEWKDVQFPRLNSLKIEDLENLITFCKENSVEFPALKKLEIKTCPEFKVFVLKNMSIDMTTNEHVGEMSSVEIQPFFDDKVLFPELEEMLISHLDNLKMIWSNKLAYHSFDKLKLIKVEGCSELLSLYPSDVLGRFSRLESLIIDKCHSIEEIFGPRGLNFDTAHSIRVNKLKLVSVSNCDSLKNMFHASTAKSLLKLEELCIKRCRVLAEIVAQEQGAETSAARFVFPNVTCLVLAYLPNLNSFYPGEHTSEWPKLEALTVADCEKVKTFASETLGFEKTNEEGQFDIPPQIPLFSVEKIIPRLENLQLSMKDFMMVCHCQFEKIKILVIRENEEAFFRLSLLDGFYNLKILTLGYSAYKELFSYEDMEKHAGNLARIKRLRLENLSVLQHIWKQDFKLNSNLQNLETLEVERCDNLINLASASACFQNLTILKVSYCKGMKSLLTSSSAKSLEQLREMSIEGCERMTEIVADESDVAEDEIVFNKLDELLLVDLKSLTSFCSANHALKFPSLEILIVRNCPAMKIFCGGALSTSKLEMVYQSKEDWRLDRGCWEGELNTTVQHLYSKTNVHSSEEDSVQPSVLLME